MPKTRAPYPTRWRGASRWPTVAAAMPAGDASAGLDGEDEAVGGGIGVEDVADERGHQAAHDGFTDAGDYDEEQDDAQGGVGGGEPGSVDPFTQPVPPVRLPASLGGRWPDEQ